MGDNEATYTFAVDCSYPVTSSYLFGDIINLTFYDGTIAQYIRACDLDDAAGRLGHEAVVSEEIIKGKAFVTDTVPNHIGWTISTLDGYPDWDYITVSFENQTYPAGLYIRIYSRTDIVFYEGTYADGKLSMTQDISQTAPVWLKSFTAKDGVVTAILSFMYGKETVFMSEMNVNNGLSSSGMGTMAYTQCIGSAEETLTLDINGLYDWKTYMVTIKSCGVTYKITVNL